MLCKDADHVGAVQQIIGERRARDPPQDGGRGPESVETDDMLPGFTPQVTAEGITCYGIPMGSEAHVAQALQARVQDIEGTVEAAKDLLGEGHHHELWAMTRISFQNKLDHWASLVPPEAMMGSGAATDFDKCIQDAASLALGVEFGQAGVDTAPPALPDDAYTLPRARYRLKLKDGGLGIRPTVDTMEAAYLGAAANSIALFCKTTQDGTLTGTATHLGHHVGAPMQGSATPWAHFLQGASPTATAIKRAFIAVQETMRLDQQLMDDLGRGEDIQAREEDVTRRPLYDFAVGRSTRQRILDELARHARVIAKALAETAYPLHHMERIAYMNVDAQTSAKPFEVIPSSAAKRFMDDELQVWTEQYLGLPKACCVAKAGTRIVGGARNTEEAPRMVDVHGTAFFSLGVRGSFTHRHDYVQQAIVSLARWARCDVDPEAYDLFAQYFPAPPPPPPRPAEGDRHEDDRHHHDEQRRQGCRPDFHFHSPHRELAELKIIGAVPAHYAMEGNLRLLRSPPGAEIIGDPGQPNYVAPTGAFQLGDQRHPDYVAPVEARADRVHGEYEAKLRKAAIPNRRLSDASDEERARGQAAVDYLNTTYGRVRPLVVGAFGEINKEFGTLLATLVVNRIGRQGEHEGSRGAKSIATNYARQVVGVAAAKAQARFILASVGSVEGITNRDLHRTAVQRRADRRVADELLREEEARAFMQAGERVHGASFRRAEW